MEKITLQTSPDDLSTAWERINNLRADAQVVKIEPDLLKNLLLDHATMFDLVKGQIQNV
jgi:hypothetical protein